MSDDATDQLAAAENLIRRVAGPPIDYSEVARVRDAVWRLIPTAASFDERVKLDCAGMDLDQMVRSQPIDGAAEAARVLRSVKETMGRGGAFDDPDVLQRVVDWLEAQ